MRGFGSRRLFSMTAGPVALVFCLAACSSSGGSTASSGNTGANTGNVGSSSGLPVSIPITMIADLTGTVAATGQSYQRGVKLGIDQVNASGVLGKSKLELSTEDSASTPATASSVMSKVVESNAAAIIGLDTSALALAAAPIAQKAKIPTLVDTAPLGLLDVGNYIYAMGPLFNATAPLLAQKIQAGGTKTVDIIYSNDNPTLTDYNTFLRSELARVNVKVSQSLGTPTAATDFSALVTRALNDNPDAMVIDTGGPSVLGITNALRTAGYKGSLYSNAAAAVPLIGAGPNANGFEFTTEWVPAVDNPQSRTMLAAFKKAYPGTQADYETVDGYNAIHFLALALAKAGSADRDAILKGLGEVAAQGFTGPSGKVTFTGVGHRQYTVSGVFVREQDGKFQIPASS